VKSINDEDEPLDLDIEPDFMHMMDEIQRPNVLVLHGIYPGEGKCRIPVYIYLKCENIDFFAPLFAPMELPKWKIYFASEPARVETIFTETDPEKLVNVLVKVPNQEPIPTAPVDVTVSSPESRLDGSLQFQYLRDGQVRDLVASLSVPESAPNKRQRMDTQVDNGTTHGFDGGSIVTCILNECGLSPLNDDFITQVCLRYKHNYDIYGRSILFYFVCNPYKSQMVKTLTKMILDSNIFDPNERDNFGFTPDDWNKRMELLREKVNSKSKIQTHDITDPNKITICCTKCKVAIAVRDKPQVLPYTVMQGKLDEEFFIVQESSTGNRLVGISRQVASRQENLPNDDITCSCSCRIGYKRSQALIVGGKEYMYFLDTTKTSVQSGDSIESTEAWVKSPVGQATIINPMPCVYFRHSNEECPRGTTCAFIHMTGRDTGPTPTKPRRRQTEYLKPAKIQKPEPPETIFSKILVPKKEVTKPVISKVTQARSVATPSMPIQRVSMHQKDSKKQLCRNFERNGYCWRGESCHFAHVSKSTPLITSNPSTYTEWHARRGPALPNVTNNLTELKTTKPHISQATLDTSTYAAILPTYAELTEPIPSDLVKNRPNRKWDSVEQYLHSHYHLLRQDFIEQFKEGIIDYNSSEKYKQPVFTDVRIEHFGVAQDCIKVRLSFRLTRQLSETKMLKILMFGSLLCLSPSDGNYTDQGRDELKFTEDTMIFGVVVGRDIEQWQVDIEPYRPIDIERLLNYIDRDFVMVESPVFFRSVEPVLQAIKDMKDGDMPFEREIVNCEYVSTPPKYILDNPLVDISILRKDDENQTVNVLADEWVSDSETKLDSSQNNSIASLFKNRLTLIRGPPGTGKTFIGTYATRLLVKKLEGTNRPIVVICYTNHALDQFLEGLIDHVPNLVRVGGRMRSKNTKIVNRSLHKIQGRKDIKEIRKVDHQLHKLRDSIGQEWIKLEERTEQILQRYLPKFISRILDTILPLGVRMYIPEHEVLNIWLEGHEEAKKEHILRQLRRGPIITVRNWFSPLAEPISLGSDSLGSGDTEGLKYNKLFDNLTDEKFDAVSSAMEELAHNQMDDFTEELYEKAIASLESCEMFARLCKSLSNSDKKSHERFKNKLLKRLADDFDYGAIPEIQKHTLSQQDIKSNQQQRKRRIMNASFTGELLKQGMIKPRDIHATLSQLLLSTNATESDIETACHFLLSCGEYIDGKHNTKLMRQYMDRISLLWREPYSIRIKRLLHQTNKARHVYHWESVQVKLLQAEALSRSEHSDKETNESIELELESKEISEFEEECKAIAQQLEADEKSEEPYATSPTKSILEEEKMLLGFVKVIQTMFAGKRTCDVTVSRRKKIVKDLRSLVRLASNKKIALLLEEAQKLVKQRVELVDENKLDALKSAPLIGLTTTSASFHRTLLKKLKAPVYIIEEVGELLEAQVIASLHKDVEHLIMIGDEQQLRPKVSTFELDRKYKLGISMFERLINMKTPSTQLSTQMRMRPEIADLMRLFYPTLVDAAGVRKYKNVVGVNQNVCFVNHKQMEAMDENGEDPRNKTNEYEAQFVTKLAAYLINQSDYREQDVTILTPYRGQLMLIRRILIMMELRGTRVATVDDFQGEENTIIIVSLVRSNPEETSGFLKQANRIIVSLSRAKEGMYVVGNFTQLRKNKYWDRIITKATNSGFVKDYIPLCCPNHKQQVTKVKHPHEFDAVQHGGCTCKFMIFYSLLVPCTEKLECGHTCPKRCHPGKHGNCEHICNQVLNCGHKCKKRCHKLFSDTCEPCLEMVDIILPVCNHTVSIVCSAQSNAKCSNKCTKKLDCGHYCAGRCGECQYLQHCKPCEAELEAKCKDCHKNFTYTCGTIPKCTHRCVAKLNCGHSCSGICGECTSTGQHGKCQQPCTKPLICGHVCSTQHECGNTKCPKCTQPCFKKCAHVQSKCKRECWELCKDCTEACTNRCTHSQCSKLCFEMCDKEECNERCTKILPCNHRCNGLCGEKCPPCMTCDAKKEKDDQICCTISLNKSSEATSSELWYVLDCGHVFQVSSLDEYVRSKSGNYLVFSKCPTCNAPMFNAPRYANEIKRTFMEMQKLKQTENVTDGNRASPINQIPEEQKQGLETKDVDLIIETLVEDGEQEKKSPEVLSEHQRLQNVNQQN
jgi:hypothetical protein